MEASALQAPVGLGRARASLRAPLLRLRSDDQLVALFRAGQDEAFRVIHDRYRQRLFAYTRQMLPRRQDAEDALQDVFVRAYAGLRASDRELALKAWLYRVAHNRCIDELRRPADPPLELIELVRAPLDDPVSAAEQRESLRRLMADVRRLPTPQRSALLMRELAGMPYVEIASALGVTVAAVKSLLVRARVTLAQALEARDTACSEIREDISVAHDRGVRLNANARRHVRECPGCEEFRRELRGVRRELAAIAPGLGPLGALANLLGGGATAGGGSAMAGGGALVSGGGLASGAAHIATLIAATVVTAGGAVEIQHAIAPVSSRQGSNAGTAGNGTQGRPHGAHAFRLPLGGPYSQIADPGDVAGAVGGSQEPGGTLGGVQKLKTGTGSVALGTGSAGSRSAGASPAGFRTAGKGGSGTGRRTTGGTGGPRGSGGARGGSPAGGPNGASGGEPGGGTPGSSLLSSSSGAGGPSPAGIEGGSAPPGATGGTGSV